MDCLLSSPPLLFPPHTSPDLCFPCCLPAARPCTPSRMVQVQQLLALCGEHVEVEEGAGWKALPQSVAVLGLGLLAMGEELGGQMAHRSLEHLLQYGDPAVRCGAVRGGRSGYTCLHKCPAIHSAACVLWLPCQLRRRYLHPQARGAAGPGAAQRVEPRHERHRHPGTPVTRHRCGAGGSAGGAGVGAGGGSGGGGLGLVSDRKVTW